MYYAGDKLPESTRDDDSTPLRKLFQTALGKLTPLEVSRVLSGNILILR